MCQPTINEYDDDGLWQTLADVGSGTGIQTLYMLYSGWIRTIYIAGMRVGVARDAARHFSID